MDVLLGRDIYDLGQVKQNFAVMTRAQTRRMEQKPNIPTAGDPPPNLRESLESQPSSSGDSDEPRGEEEGVLVAETEEDSQVGVLANGALGSLEVGGQATADTDNVLTADPAKFKQWQHKTQV